MAKKYKEYGEYKIPEYKDSDRQVSLGAQLDTHTANKPASYQSKYQQNLNDTMNKILNREKFNYDLNGDALYQQYKNNYMKQGNIAMQDTIGQAAALTGGYGNSYAVSAGQQAYNAYLDKLNDRVPELYQLALDKYNTEMQDLYNQYGLLQNTDEMDYGRYRDNLSDWLDERNYLSNELNNERSFNRNAYEYDTDLGYRIFSDNTNLQHQLDREAVEDDQWQKDSDWRKYEYENDLAYNDKWNQANLDWDKEQYYTNRNDSLAQQQIENELALQKIINKSNSSSSSNKSGTGTPTTQQQRMLEKYSNNASALSEYLESLEEEGVITESQAAYWYDLYAPKPQTPTRTVSNKPEGRLTSRDYSNRKGAYWNNLGL